MKIKSQCIVNNWKLNSGTFKFWLQPICQLEIKQNQTFWQPCVNFNSDIRNIFVRDVEITLITLTI